MAQVKDKPALARALYRPGEVGYKRVGKMLGVSPSTVRRWVDPDVAEQHRVAAREAKRRRVGVCEQCGGETRYGGHAPNGVSRICFTCATQPREFCKRGHPLTPENRAPNGRGRGTCRICRNERMRVYHAQRRREQGILRRRWASEYE